MIDQKKYEDVEARWLAQLESDPSNADDFIATAKLLRKSEERSRADALLVLLPDTLKERQLWPQRLSVLKELARLARQPNIFRNDLQEAITRTYSDRPSFQRVMDHVDFADTSASAIDKAEKIETALLYDQGEVYFMAGRGVGVVRELNLPLSVCRLDFEKEKRVSVPLGAAQKFLIPIPVGHVLRDKIDNPEKLTKTALSSQAETFARLLQSFGRPMTASEVKDAMTGIVPEAKWSSWWTAARKHPQIVISGTGARATYSWNASSEAAEETIRRDFDRAEPRSKLDIARKHSARNQPLADYFSSTLAADAARRAQSDPALSWEILTILEKLPGKYESDLGPDDLLTSPVASRVIAAIPDRALRERAIQTVRARHPEWQKVMGELFFLEDDPRVLTVIIDLLGDENAEVRNRLIDETLRYPRRHPRAFYWYCRSLADGAEPGERGGYGLLFQMLEALSSDEFGSLRGRMKEFFDKGGLAMQLIMKTDNEEQARKLSESLERYGSLEEYRRENLRAAALMKYPSLREPQAEPFYATAQGLLAKREELENLRKVEIPANSRALQEAREMGDLRENFEYKAARQRAEYLSARVGQLLGELARVRVLEPDQIDTSEVRIGTKVSIRNGDEHREVTILGPWESAPERGVYSNQSEVARALIGRRPGEIATFMGNDYEIVAISRFSEEGTGGN